MPDTLTESFCERCGTRYEFQAPTRLNPLRKTRGFIGGLRNYLTSQDALSDAMGDAMRSEESGLATAQLDAFHESFNFCIDCRQYTCVNCWNDDAGRCRSCAPIPGTDDLAERLAASASPMPAVAAESHNGDIHEHWATEAWPMSDLSAGGEAPAVAAEVETEMEPQPIAAEWVEAEIEPQPIAAEWVEAEPDPIAAEAEREQIAAHVQPEPVAADVEAEPEPTLPPLRVVDWDEDEDYLVRQPLAAGPDEPIATDVEAEVEPEPIDAEVEPEPIAAEAPAASVDERDEPEYRAPRLGPISDTILRFPSRGQPTEPASDEPAAAAATNPELAARRAQLDLLGLGDPGRGPLAADRPAMPYRSRGAAVSPAEHSRQATAAGSFWEASAREVAAAAGQIGVQSCGQCGLSLSANARFCRRCGTQQARSA